MNMNKKYISYSVIVLVLTLSLIFRLLMSIQLQPNATNSGPPLDNNEADNETESATPSDNDNIEADDNDNETGSPIIPDNFPEFPWPPPASSSTEILSAEAVRAAIGSSSISFNDVDNWLITALDLNDYSDTSYYHIPEGFALVTQMEAINSDGTSKSESRWVADRVPALSRFSLFAYVKALFNVEPGYFRVIVFAVTSNASTQTGDSMDRQEAMELLREGASSLPSSIGESPFSADHEIVTLIYEFEQSRGDSKAKHIIPGRISGKDHLRYSKIAEGLGIL